MPKPIRNLLLLLILITVPACTESRQAALLEKADERIAQGKYTEAVDILRRIITMRSHSRVAVKALYKLGFTLESYLKDFDGALYAYQEFTNLSTDRVSVYEVQKRIANIYFEQNREPEKAVAAYKKLISFNAESLEVDVFQYRIGEAYFRQNNFEAARYEYQRLLERFPKSQFAARARFAIGNAYYMESRYDIAIEALKQVVRHHSDSEYALEAQFLMAQSLEHQDRLANALQVYENIQGRYMAPDVLQLRMEELKKRIAKAEGKRSK